MPLLLCRVDDRLIHGQVVLGWGRPLGLERIVLVDDGVAANEWEQELYRMAVPQGLEVLCVSTADAIARLDAWREERTRTALLTGDLPTMVQLHAANPQAVHRINLGGIHHRHGRTERLPYLYLTDAELGLLRGLAEAGAEISAQDLPTTQPVKLETLL